MKKIYSFLVCSVSLIFIYGCMEEINRDMVDIGEATLNSRHVGWKNSECFTCHPKSDLYSDDEKRIVHSVIHNDEGLAICGSCHGDNGNVIDNGKLSGCTNCHKDVVVFIPVNSRFLPTHTKKENLMLSDVDCRLCHDITAHPTKNTSLNIMDNSQCLFCHNEHGKGFNCSSCHEQGDGCFYRNKNGVITGHRITIPGE